MTNKRVIWIVTVEGYDDYFDMIRKRIRDLEIVGTRGKAKVVEIKNKGE